MARKEQESDSMVVGYLTLRKLVGAVGMALPVVLSLSSLLPEVGDQGSMSAYYHTPMRDIFVGALCAIGVFLFVYRGYDPRDFAAGLIAGSGAVGTALFRTTPFGAKTDLVGGLHYAFAAIFLGTLAYFCLGLFILTEDPATMTEEKKKRNIIYRICGYIIVASLLLIVANGTTPQIEDVLRPLNPLFLFEEIAVLFFGVSWFTKGEAIFADRPQRA
jgi:hypothetical protein